MDAHVSTSCTVSCELYPHFLPPYLLKQGFSLNKSSWTGKTNNRGLKSHLSMSSSLGYRVHATTSVFSLVLGIQTQVQCLHSKNFTESSFQSPIYFHCLLSMIVTDLCVFLQNILECCSYLACITCWGNTNKLIKEDFFLLPFL